jgi:hypothetical protein
MDSISLGRDAIQSEHGLGEAVGNCFQDRELALDGLEALGALSEGTFSRNLFSGNLGNPSEGTFSRNLFSAFPRTHA